MATAKVHKRIARKDYPKFGIEKGQEHYTWDMVIDGKYQSLRSLTEPTLEEITSKPSGRPARKRKTKPKPPKSVESETRKQIAENRRKKPKHAGETLKLGRWKDEVPLYGRHVALDVATVYVGGIKRGIIQVSAVEFEPEAKGEIYGQQAFDWTLGTDSRNLDDVKEDLHDWLSRPEITQVWTSSADVPYVPVRDINFRAICEIGNYLVLRYGRFHDTVDAGDRNVFSALENAIMLAEHVQKILRKERRS